MLFDVMGVGTHANTTIPREGEGLLGSYFFCSRGVGGNCSSGVVATV